MSYNITLHPKAHEELENSYNWYEERTKGLGVRINGYLKLQIILKGIQRKKETFVKQ